jgi:hypothetical protein
LHLTQALVAAALQTPGAVDTDILAALESLIQTYRTLQSGVYYESRPTNPLAASIFQAVFEAAQHFSDTERESGISKTRDSDILRGLVFLHRIGVDRKNGRPRGRAFLDLLAPMAKPNERGENAAASSLIVL